MFIHYKICKIPGNALSEVLKMDKNSCCQTSCIKSSVWGSFPTPSKQFCMKHWYPYSFHSVKFYSKHNIKICICLTTYLDLKFTELSGFIQRGRGGGGAVADLGLAKGEFKSENQNNFSHTHYWFNTPLYSSQQRGKHKIYIPYFICIIQKHNC